MTATIIVGQNSWITLAEADAYFESRINAEPWKKLNDNDRAIYLISAFNWLYYDPSFLAPKTTIIDAVKFGQCEAAFFLITYAGEIEKRQALIAGGVESFDFSKWSEKLTEVKKPQIVINYFSAVNYYGGGNGFAVVSTDETDV